MTRKPGRLCTLHFARLTAFRGRFSVHTVRVARPMVSQDLKGPPVAGSLDFGP